MMKTLTRVGNSYGIIIDKPILELLHITPETPLEVSMDGEALVIRPQQFIDHETAMRIGKKIMKVHEKTFRRLAE